MIRLRLFYIFATCVTFFILSCKKESNPFLGYIPAVGENKINYYDIDLAFIQENANQLSGAPIIISDVHSDFENHRSLFIIYKTDEYRFGKMRITRSTASNEWTYDIRYLTYNPDSTIYAEHTVLKQRVDSNIDLDLKPGIWSPTSADFEIRSSSGGITNLEPLGTALFYLVQ